VLSNRSPWTDFLLVRCDSRHDGNVVLLGNAEHTAHFSIGSGTKLAMEDAIALSQAFVRHPGDLKRALVECELERQPVVDRFQQAAGESAGLLHARGAQCAHGPNAVRVQPAHPQRPRDAREPRAAGRHSGDPRSASIRPGRVSLGV
jgi:2-polyprenyl-6-methoxyphenol hydroxylase-like FAD-dependent oxidoreductase